MSGPDWDAVPEPERQDYSIRSRVQYPDPAPEMTAQMWDNLRAERKARMEVVDESEYDIVITQEAVEFDEPCGPLATYVKLVHQNGWEIVTLAHSQAFAKGKPYKSGANEGKPRPDENIEQQWLHAKRGGERLIVAYEVVNGTVRGARTLRRINGVRLADAEMKARIKL